MSNLKRYPLFSVADSLKRAFVLSGFQLCDNCESSEIINAEQALITAFDMPETSRPEPIYLEDGGFALRSDLLIPQLSSMRGTLPICSAAIGRIYDKKGGTYPAHLFLQGVYANRDISFKEYKSIWEQIIQELYGVTACVKLEPLKKEQFQIIIQNEDDEFTFGYTGPAGWFAKTLLGTDLPEVTTWIFSIDIDAVAIHDLSLENREELYSVLQKDLKKCDSSSPAYGNSFINKAGNLLRKRGYLEFCGSKLYEDDAYLKMNMIQESWDKNNKGVTLMEPIGNKTGLPTVLTPSLEEALSLNYKAGEETVKIYEIGHIFRPKSGAKPRERISLSIGAYGPEIDKKSFRMEIDQFLTELGISNHFFFPTDMAIAYDITDCWLVLDEKLHYLEGNLGGISPIAEKNHGIGIHAFMAQFELEPLEEKASVEYAFVPNELK